MKFKELLVSPTSAGDAQTQEEMVKAVPMLADIVAYEDLKVGPPRATFAVSSMPAARIILMSMTDASDTITLCRTTGKGSH